MRWCSTPCIFRMMVPLSTTHWSQTLRAGNGWPAVGLPLVDRNPPSIFVWYTDAMLLHCFALRCATLKDRLVKSSLPMIYFLLLLLWITASEWMVYSVAVPAASAACCEFGSRQGHRGHMTAILGASLLLQPNVSTVQIMGKWTIWAYMGVDMYPHMDHIKGRTGI